MQGSSRRINSSTPLRLSGSIANQPKKPVTCLAWEESGGGHFVCATRDQLSVWKADCDQGQEENTCSNGTQDKSACGLKLLFGHVLEASEKRAFSHVVVRAGFVVAVGRSSAAKRKKENKGILSQINPTVFAKIARVRCNGTGDSHARMAELELPLSLAQWDGFGGLCAFSEAETAPAAFSLIVADPDGKLAKLTLEMENDKPAGRQVSSAQHCGLKVAHCRMLPAVSGQGKLNSLLVPNGRQHLVVGAFLHSVIVWDHHRSVLLTCILTSSFSPHNSELTSCCAMTSSAEDKVGDSIMGGGASLQGLHLLFAFDTSRSRGRARGGRKDDAPEHQALSSLLEASQGEKTTDAIFLSQLELCVSQSSQLSHADAQLANAGPDDVDQLPTSCVVLSLEEDGDSQVSRRLTVYERASAEDSAPRKRKGDEDTDAEEDWTAAHVRAGTMASNHTYAAVGCANGTVAVWNVVTAQQVAMLRDREGKNKDAGRPVTAIALNPSFAAVAVGRADGAVDVWAV